MQKRTPRLIRQYRRSQVMLYSILLPAFALAMTWSGSLESTRRMALVVLGFSAIVFVHELGHFLVARACSVKCEAFSIGIGPRLCGWRQGLGFSFGSDKYDKLKEEVAKRSAEKSMGELEDEKAGIEPNPTNLTADILGKTVKKIDLAAMGPCDYRIAMLPLGGYVRMLGQDDMDPTKVSDDPHAFNRRPIWQRMCIVSAGVIMNLICAAVIFSIIFSPGIGVKFPPAIVGQVLYGSPAYRAGLKFGDQIVSIDGKKPLGFIEFTDVVIAGALSSGNDPIAFEVARPGEPGTHVLNITPERLQQSGFLAIGIEPMPSLNVAVGAAETDSDTEIHITAGENGAPAKLEHGDQITEVNGQAVSDFVALHALLQENGSKPLRLTLHNNNPSIPDRIANVTPEIEVRTGVAAFPAVLGIGPRFTVMSVAKGSPAQKAALKPGDIVLKVGERSNPTESEFQDIIARNPGRTLSLSVERDRAPVQMAVTPEDKQGKGMIGISIASDDSSDVAVVRDPNCAAADSNLFRGSESVHVAALDGNPVKNWTEILNLLRQKKADDSVTVTLKTDKQQDTCKLALNAAQIEKLRTETTVKLGMPLEFTQQLQQAASSGQAVLMGLEHTKKFILQVYFTLAGMVRQTISVDNLHGPLAIAKVGIEVQEKGQVWLWYLMAMVSVNLAVANFLPLPIVDGGLFLLLILEKIRGRPLSIKTQSIIQTVGIVLLACVFLFVTLNNDIPFLMHH